MQSVSVALTIAVIVFLLRVDVELASVRADPASPASPTPAESELLFGP